MATILSHIVSLKVRLCSPFAAGHKLLVGASLDYPKLLRLALPNALHARISSVSVLYIFLQVHILIFVLVQNLPRNIQVGSVFSWVIAWRRRLGFWDDARWARRHLV